MGASCGKSSAPADDAKVVPDTPPPEINEDEIVYSDPAFDAVFTKGVQLGVGYTSRVFKCTNQETDETFAVKEINKKKLNQKSSRNGSLLNRLRVEIDICKRVDHEYIVKIHQVFEDENFVYLVMDHMEGGELFDEIIDRGSLSEKEASDIVRKITVALQYLHDQGISHRDLKPENVLLANKKDITDIKVIDFGMSKVFGPGEVTTASTLGTPGYMAPEIMQSKKYTEAVDIWALGVITYIILCGYMPFDDTHGRATKWRTDFPPAEWDSISKEAKNLIESLLCVDPDKRPTSEDILEHEWFSMWNEKEDKQLASPRRMKDRKKKRFVDDDDPEENAADDGDKPN